MSIFMDIKGTSVSSFQISKGGPRFTNNSGKLEAKNAANTLYVDFLAQILRSVGNSVVLNENATSSGADWKMTISRPASGMSAALNFVLPPDYGTSGYFLTTDGAGNLTWAAVSSPTVSDKITVKSSSIAFGTSSPIAMFTLPANAVVLKVKVIIDTAFDGAPTLKVGIVGTTN